MPPSHTKACWQDFVAFSQSELTSIHYSHGERLENTYQSESSTGMLGGNAFD